MLATGLIVGLLVGFVIQRSRFCVTGMLRDIFTLKSWRGFTALLVVIAVHGLGLTALTSLGIIHPDYDRFAPVAVIVGAFIFGLGIILAAGCASGTWARSGEGLVGSWIALGFYAISAAAMKAGFAVGFAKKLKSYKTSATTIPHTLGLSPWVFAIGLVVVTAWLVSRYVRHDASVQAPASARGNVKIAKPLDVFVGGALIGVLGVVAWPLSAAAGRNDGLGITTPSSNLVRFITTGDIHRIDWGVLLVVGILLGSYVAAKASGEFRVRVPDAQQVVRSIFGGIAMGVGASLAGGCTVGNGMVQTGLFSWQGWIALVFFGLGVGVAAKLWLSDSAEHIPASELDADEIYAAYAGKDDDEQARAASGITNRDDAQPLVGQPGDDVSPVALADEGSSGDGNFSLLGGGTAVATLTRPRTRDGVRALAPHRWILDTVGAVCPFPLIKAKKAIATIPDGDELVIEFDCTQATDALPRWAATAGHTVTSFEADGKAGWVIAIKKNGSHS